MAEYVSQIAQLRAKVARGGVIDFEPHYTVAKKVIESLLPSHMQEAREYVTERMLWEMFFRDPFCGVPLNKFAWPTVTQQALFTRYSAALTEMMVLPGAYSDLPQSDISQLDQTINLLQRSLETSKKMIDDGNQTEAQLNIQIAEALNLEGELRTDIAEARNLEEGLRTEIEVLLRRISKRDQTVSLLQRSIETSKKKIDDGNQTEAQLNIQIAEANSTTEIEMLLGNRAPTVNGKEDYLFAQVGELMVQTKQKNEEVQTLNKELNSLRRSQNKLTKSNEGLADEVKKLKLEVRDARKKQKVVERTLQKNQKQSEPNLQSKGKPSEPKHPFGDWGAQ
ncbi:uncharacterized protein BP5553_00742 [Venustampulla echinocandica]|uniref:Uncharacterized protein n=1 Tax=Venustampulla echinocandica TaxID=2656787 RepID=A0A370TZ09_9HELO|nr:uncharacterized protein BP5553_00742 [Venustampulla echinocandica]RDL40763.1 hypothetical protein BP5553_00742 [Venustampulla echinocandica]